MGIGTTEPNVELDLRSTSMDNVAGINLGNINDSRWLWINGGRDGNPDWGPGPGIYWQGAYPLRFVSHSGQYNELMRLTGDGLLGLGTDSPGAKLEVVGKIRSSHPEGGFIFPDGSLQTTAATAGGNSLDAAYDVGRTITADAGSFEVGGVDGVLFTGTYESGIIPATGAGTRMMWYPRKASFRVGRVFSTQWNDANIGIYSMAMGNNTIAIGDYSTAFGWNTTASGFASTALGRSTTASGYNATAMGLSSIASGNYATTFGSQTTASGQYSMAMGQEIEARGSHVVAIALSDQNALQVTQDSTMAIMGGKVGIGTIAPTTELEVVGKIRSSHPDGGFIFPDGSEQTTAAGSGGVISINDLTDGKTGGSSVFLGSGAGINDDGTDNNNTAVGTNALSANTSGWRNTANGYYALSANTSGYGNTANGFMALYANITGQNNTAIGYNSLYTNTDGDYNTAMGSNALNKNTTGYGNSATGYSALSKNTTGYSNSATGYNALANNTVGYENTALGNHALLFNQDGNYNTAVGFLALSSNTSASNNSAFGYKSLDDNTTGHGNTAVGYSTLQNNTIGYLNTAIGDYALSNNTEGNGNTATGHMALSGNIDGGGNTGTGSQALWRNTSGSSNTATGQNSLFSNTSGYENTAMGVSSLKGNTSGLYNVGIGNSANFNNQEGSYNTIIGARAGYGSDLHNKSGNVFIGYNAGYNETGDDKLYIENSNSDTPLIYGDFVADFVAIYGDMNIIGDDTDDARISISNGGGVHFIFDDDDGGHDLKIESASGTDLVFNTNGPNERMRLPADGGALLTGTYGVGTIPVEGPGTRMMWYPAKAAFRAGHVEWTEWDDVNIGDYSFAVGYRTTASSGYSTAMGWRSTASGGLSTAMGDNTTASGATSTSMGSITTASGDYSTAMGYNTTAGGDKSTAMGSYVTAQEDGAFAIGDNSTTTTTTFTIANTFNARFANGFRLYTVSGSPWVGASLLAGANAWTTMSDSTIKENIQPVNSEDILSKIGLFKLSTWNYIGQDAAKFRHYGPMAQDFFAAFGHDGIGTIGCDTLLSSADFDGINFIAIQALEKRTTDLRMEYRELKAENRAMRDEINKLKSMIREFLSTAQARGETNKHLDK